MNLKTIIELVKSIIASEHLSSIVRDVTEVVVDTTIVKEGVLRDIQGVNTFYNLCKIPGAIKQRQITNKIKEFLEDLSNLSYE